LCTIPGQLDNTGLVMDKNGQFLYGMTFGLYGQTIRQASGTGALFAVSVSTGKYQELHSFTGGADGSRPRGNLTLDSSGSYLYGTTSTGGANGNGTVFQF